MDKFEIRRINLRKLRDERFQGKNSKFSEFLGMDPSYLSRLLSDPEKNGHKRIGEDTRDLVEQKCGLQRGWLDVLHDNNVALVGIARNTGDVPLISWVRAGQWSDVADPYAVGDAEEWKACPVRHGDRSYALKVKGFSMSNPGGKPSFEEGDIIFVDPDREPAHRSLVIVRLDDQNEATFKRLIIDGESKFLEALNPSWPDRIIKVNGNATFCGVVIARMESYI